MIDLFDWMYKNDGRLIKRNPENLPGLPALLHDDDFVYKVLRSVEDWYKKREKSGGFRFEKGHFLLAEDFLLRLGAEIEPLYNVLGKNIGKGQYLHRVFNQVISDLRPGDFAAIHPLGFPHDYLEHRIMEYMARPELHCSDLDWLLLDARIAGEIVRILDKYMSDNAPFGWREFGDRPTYRWFLFVMCWLLPACLLWYARQFWLWPFWLVYIIGFSYVAYRYFGSRKPIKSLRPIKDLFFAYDLLAERAIYPPIVHKALEKSISNGKSNLQVLLHLLDLIRSRDNILQRIVKASSLR